jgi:ATP-dependent 26S proteasome regulatory subunit
VLINNTLRKCQAKQQPCCHEEEREEEELEEDQLHSVEEVKREGEVLVERMKMCQDIMDRYLDLINNKNFVVKTRNGRRTQIRWFDQKTLTIKSKLNSYSWDIVNSGRGRDMQIWSTNSRWW